MAMKKTKEKVNQLVQEELEMANDKFPQFVSPHEGYAVILEEYEELRDECDSSEFKRSIERLWDSVKSNTHKGWQGKDNIDTLRERSINIACEAIQLAAMCDKFTVLQ